MAPLQNCYWTLCVFHGYEVSGVNAPNNENTVHNEVHPKTY